MMGEIAGQSNFYSNISLEQFVLADHPLRTIGPFIDVKAIRRECRSLYSAIGRPSIPPEQLFPALVGGYLLGIYSDRNLVMELQCNMALKWFVGLGLDERRLRGDVPEHLRGSCRQAGKGRQVEKGRSEGLLPSVDTDA